MKKIFLLSMLLCGLCSEYVAAQEKKPSYSAPPTTLEEKRERKQNRVVKEWNTEGKRKWMDHSTVYNPEGYKIEETEFSSYGQKLRTTYEYDENGKCIKEVVYNDKNKADRIRKYEYNPDGTKKTQYNYLPNGKLFSVKVYEYSYQ